MTTSNNQKIGLFGGTFDPVHSGHVIIARCALQQCSLDKVLFIPAPHPPHKKAPLASFAHRVKMLRLALSELANVDVSLIERECSRPSYTVNTVNTLKQRHADASFFLILGADSLVDLPYWHKAGELLAKIQLVVAGREKVAEKQLKEALALLIKMKPPGENTAEKLLSFLPDMQWPVSSSSIRRQLAEGKRPDMLPDAVYSYIVTNQLYRN
ncbi:MAG: nicotinate (nicotinamide) nucleotide adenylyltransferase [Desulfobulbus propionicus]|nr:MAG: nicotinate (nicotinamide) nucleotide adenylyltransferase [Desulfobulbus propionicus]